MNDGMDYSHTYMDYSYTYVELKQVVDKLHFALLEGEWEIALAHTDSIAVLCRFVRAAILDTKEKTWQK